MKPEDLNTYDWRSAFDYAPFSTDDVAEILYYEEGYNDGDSWVGVFKLKDGKFGYVDAWCDYTGWDCQASNCGDVAASLADIIAFGLSTEERKRFGLGDAL